MMMELIVSTDKGHNAHFRTVGDAEYSKWSVLTFVRKKICIMCNKSTKSMQNNSTVIKKTG